MIALLLVAQMGAAQLGAAQLAAPLPADVLVQPRPAFAQQRPFTSAAACSGTVGRMEASLAQPAALYRKGDRPAKGLRRWADFPEATLCAIGTGR